MATLDNGMLITDSSLQLALANIQEKSKEWWTALVFLAKSNKIRYFDFRKILSRILREKNIMIAGYRKMLATFWYTAA